jgi:hypothetical protein
MSDTNPRASRIVTTLNRLVPAFLAVAILLGGTGCTGRELYIKAVQERDRLKVERDQLQRQAETCRVRAANLSEQVTFLTNRSADQPADLFAPVRIEIVSRSGGKNFDDRPGDDGVVVYVRPVDQDGHAVKTPGRIDIEVLDVAEPGRPRVLGQCVYSSPKELRQMWYGRFATDHYTAHCRFSPGARPPIEPRVLVNVRFLDYLTGRTLTQSTELTYHPPG